MSSALWLMGATGEGSPLVMLSGLTTLAVTPI